MQKVLQGLVPGRCPDKGAVSALEDAFESKQIALVIIDHQNADLGCLRLHGVHHSTVLSSFLSRLTMVEITLEPRF